MSRSRKRKLRAQITYPITEKCEIYWQCPGKACQHYQHVTVGTKPEGLIFSIVCPICKKAYRAECLSRTGATVLVVATMLE